MPFSGIKTCEEEANAGEKKRRLTQEQVRSLENYFELGKKLEPERKLALATTLGLQPKQVAIWFQNRRARWKAKELEKDYDVLKSKFQEIKSEHDSLKSQNKKLQAKILALKGKQELLNLNIETEACFSNRSENSSEKNNLDWSSANPSIWLSDMDHLLQSSSRSSEIHGNSQGGGSFSQLLCSMEEQPSVFSWFDRNSSH